MSGVVSLSASQKGSGARSRYTNDSDSDSDSEGTPVVVVENSGPVAPGKPLGLVLSVDDPTVSDEPSEFIVPLESDSTTTTTDDAVRVSLQGLPTRSVPLPPVDNELNPFLDDHLLAETLPNYSVEPIIKLAIPPTGGNRFSETADDEISPLIQPIESLDASTAATSTSSAPVLSLPTRGGGIAARRGKKIALPVALSETDDDGFLTPVGPRSPEGFVSKSGAFKFGHFKVGLHGVQAGVNAHESDSGNSNIQLDELEVIGSLGEGAQGHVDKVVHVPSGAILARKTLRVDMKPGEDAHKKRRELFTEVKTYMESNSPYVVRSLGSFFNNGMVTIVLEFMDCGSLENVIKKCGPLPEDMIAAIADQCVQALIYLHDVRKLFHRDIKPANILLNSDGEAKITDFGVSKEAGSTIEQNTFVGTLVYMSPERIDTTRSGGSAVFCGDVWALGLVLVECALGEYPYEFNEEQPFDYMHSIINRDAPVDEWLPADRFSQAFRDFVAACLAREAGERPQANELPAFPFLTEREPIDLAQQLRDMMLFDE